MAAKTVISKDDVSEIDGLCFLLSTLFVIFRFAKREILKLFD